MKAAISRGVGWPPASGPPRRKVRICFRQCTTRSSTSNCSCGLRKSASTDEEFAQRVAETCAVIADRVCIDSTGKDAGVAIRGIFEIGKLL